MNILKALTDRRIVGNFGEEAAAKFLKKNGYKILKRNFVSPSGEIDIIASTSDTVAFIEVKTRNSDRGSLKEPRPASSVTPEKQRKIISASKHYHSKENYGKRRRFDVIEVYLEGERGKEKIKEIKHLINTFDLNTAYKNYAYLQRKRQ